MLSSLYTASTGTFPPPNAAKLRLKLKRVVMANPIKLTRVFNQYNRDMAAVTLQA